jgi:hypothetical protein
VSYGAGVQSTALLALAALGEIDFPLFIFANVGDDSEHPASLAYFRDHAMPFAAKHGIELVEVSNKPKRGRFAGQTATLYKELTHPDARTVGAPVRLPSGAPGMRSCTANFKIRPVARELKRRGATKETPALVAIGISVDEIQRAKPGIDPREPTQNRTYPLLDLGIHRKDCPSIIQSVGLPVPSASSCYFCPFHSPEHWRVMRRLEPDLFEQSVALEQHINARGLEIGRKPVYFHDALIPLDRAVDEQPTLPGMDDCGGWCHT